MYNILLGGAAGDGIETMSALLEKMLKQSGCHLFTIRDFMSGFAVAIILPRSALAINHLMPAGIAWTASLPSMKPPIGNTS